ncbi:MAG: UPF0158 family protein [Saprospiraceae bacterium]
MSIIKPPVIKEIARAIAIGNTCYLQRFSGKVTTIDNSLEDAEAIATQEATQAEIERKIENYVKIESLSTQDQLVIMRDFLEEIPDKSVRKQLSNALNRKNPIRNFNQAIENDMGLNQHWRNFNFEEYQRWVSNLIIDAYNY